mmetsp:Transcript_48394/g.96912  ORF Transcript_48394/g.96912 Transcript_48394/m.96912 type:complete len:289 (+) Transcript_48394:205-1071(+)
MLAHCPVPSRSRPFRKLVCSSRVHRTVAFRVEGIFRGARSFLAAPALPLVALAGPALMLALSSLVSAGASVSRGRAGAGCGGWCVAEASAGARAGMWRLRSSFMVESCRVRSLSWRYCRSTCSCSFSCSACTAPPSSAPPSVAPAGGDVSLGRQPIMAPAADTAGDTAGGTGTGAGSGSCLVANGIGRPRLLTPGSALDAGAGSGQGTAAAAHPIEDAAALALALAVWLALSAWMYCARAELAGSCVRLGANAGTAGLLITGAEVAGWVLKRLNEGVDPRPRRPCKYG